jgi:hypothetical protein
MRLKFVDVRPIADSRIMLERRWKKSLWAVFTLVCAPVSAEERLIVITTYQPDPIRWELDLRRRKR